MRRRGIGRSRGIKVSRKILDTGRDQTNKEGMGKKKPCRDKSAWGSKRPSG